MERPLKERIVGATVIVALGIIVIPWLLDGPAQSSRPVEQALDLPAADPPGRTYTIPLDPAAGPPVQVGGSSAAEPVPSRPGAGAVQRPPPDEEPAAPVATPESRTGAAAEPKQTPPAPVQPAPRPSPTATTPTAPAQSPQQAPASAGPWVVQVGSFSQPDNADALRRRLADGGFEAFVSRVATDAGTMHRVRVGPVPDREAADRLRARLVTAGEQGARVVRAED